MERPYPGRWLNAARWLFVHRKLHRIVEAGSMRYPLGHHYSEHEGQSTLLWSQLDAEVYSIDVNPAASENTRNIVGPSGRVTVLNEDALEVLRRFTLPIDLLYLDAWDLGSPQFQERHLEAYQLARKHLHADSIVLIDDTDVEAEGKGALVIPAAERDGYRRLLHGRQTLLARFEPGPITGVILARNEEQNIVECLRTLKPFVRELILIDMESEDRTVELARPWVDKVLRHPRVPFFDGARNVAIAEATYDWQWFVDADERVPLPVGALVTEWLASRGHEFDAITIPFKNYFCGQWMQHCGWWPGYTMPRVLKRGHFRFAEELHQGVQLRGREALFPADPTLAVDHHSYQSIEHWVEKANRYTSTEALSLARQDENYDWRSAMRAMTKELWTYYEHNQGHADGTLGWVLSWLSGQYRWLSRTKLLDLNGVVADDDVPGSLDEVFDVCAEELARLRAKQPQEPLGVVWRSSVFVANEFASSSRVLIKALSSGPRPMCVRALSEERSEANVAGSDTSLLRALCRCRRPKWSVTITAGMPGVAEPDPNATFNVLRTWCDTDRIPDQWYSSLAAFDEIWVPSQANRKALCRNRVPPEKVRVVPECVDSPLLYGPQGQQAPLPPVLEGRFVFLTVLAWQLGTGWDVLLEAYCREFSPTDGTGLLIRVAESNGCPASEIRSQADAVLGRLGQSVEGRSDVVFAIGSTSDAEMPGLYRSAGAFVLASRGEVSGRRFLEAMACGLPTIGTCGAGNGDFMNSDNSFLVATEAPVSPDAAAESPLDAGHRWPEPDLVDLRQKLRLVYSDAPLRDRVREAALGTIAANHSLEAASRLLEERLESLDRLANPPAITSSDERAIPVTLVGDYYVGNSFSHVNEHLAAELAKDRRIQLSLELDQAMSLPVVESAMRRDLEPLVRPQEGTKVTIRHGYPPNWQPPSQGRWVHIQPWEFGALPRAWATPLRREVDEIWVNSHFVRRAYERSGVPTERIQVIPLGVDSSVFHPDADPWLLPFEDRFVFLYVGGTIPRKGFDLVLEAYRTEFSPEEKVCLIVKDVGPNSFYRFNTIRDGLLATLDDPEFAHVMYLDDHLTAGQLAGLYRAADCLVAPYRGEGFGLPVLEAMACGIPPIVPGGGATDDFVSEETGWRLPAREVEVDIELRTAVPPTELEVSVTDLRARLRYVYEHPEENAAKGREAAIAARHFSWSRTARETAERIVALAANPKPLQRELPAEPPSRPTLTLGVLASNHEHCLGACLASAEPYVDEIIVVHQGATDRTPDLARQFTSRVFEAPRHLDLARARNCFVRRATSDWILWLEPEETIAANEAEALQQFLADAPSTVAGAMVQVARNGSDEPQIRHELRLFRNEDSVMFEFPIDAQVLSSVRRAGGEVTCADVEIAGSSLGEATSAEYAGRLRSLAAALQSADSQNQPTVRFELGLVYYGLADYSSAAEQLRAYLSADDREYRAWATAYLVSCLERQEERDDAVSLRTDAYALLQSDPLLAFCLGQQVSDDLLSPLHY